MQHTLMAYSCRPDSPDADLIQGCLKGHRLAQQYLYERYAGQMMGICLRYAGCRDEAMEMLNAAFFNVFQRIGQYEARGPLKAWIAKVVIYACIDWVRKQAKYRKVMDYESTEDAPVSNEAIQRLAVEELLEKIQQLPPATRMVFVMYAIEGYKHGEIADKLNISEGTSKWHLSTARKHLQKLLKS